MAKPEYFSIAGFESTQHYKNRNPPWIRLHYELLDKEEFIDLDCVSRCYYMTLLLVASKKNNRILLDPVFLQKVMRLDHQPDLTPLFNRGLLLAERKHRTSKRLSECKQNAVPEADNSDNSDNSNTDTHHKNLNGHGGPQNGVKRPDGVSPQTWDDFLALRKGKKSPFTQTALNRMLVEVEKSGKTLEEVLQICCERGWQGFKAEWVCKEEYYA